MSDYSYAMLRKAGLTAGDWSSTRLDDNRNGVRAARGQSRQEHIPAMLKPDDPGENCAPFDPRIRPLQLHSPPIAMHIGPWHRDEHGNRWREIMSEETWHSKIS